MRRRPPLVLWLSPGLAMCGLTLACGLQSAPAPPTRVADDPFAVVRATSEAAYASGTTHLRRGEAVQALVDLDTASTHDPDGRPEIQLALSQAVQQVQSLTPTSEPTPAAQPLALATLAAPAGAPAADRARQSVATPPSRQTDTPLDAAAPSVATSALTAESQTAPGFGSRPATLLAWQDPLGRFSIGAPSDWQNLGQPQALFGTAVVEFSDPSGSIEFSVAVDDTARVISPELYAAGMEIAMQRSLPGYAAEQALPGTTAGQPSVHRVFTFTQTDATGRSVQARGFQTTLLKGLTAYILSGSTPADQFQQHVASFDLMVGTFRFS